MKKILINLQNENEMIIENIRKDTKLSYNKIINTIIQTNSKDSNQNEFVKNKITDIGL